MTLCSSISNWREKRTATGEKGEVKLGQTRGVRGEQLGRGAICKHTDKHKCMVHGPLDKSRLVCYDRGRSTRA